MRVIQIIIDRIKAASYLEIGVLAGDVFLQMKARRKWAVDPEFKIGPAKKI